MPEYNANLLLFVCRSVGLSVIFTLKVTLPCSFLRSTMLNVIKLFRMKNSQSMNGIVRNFMKHTFKKGMNYL